MMTRQVTAKREIISMNGVSASLMLFLKFCKKSRYCMSMCLLLLSLWLLWGSRSQIAVLTI